MSQTYSQDTHTPPAFSNAPLILQLLQPSRARDNTPAYQTDLTGLSSCRASRFASSRIFSLTGCRASGMPSFFWRYPCNLLHSFFERAKRSSMAPTPNRQHKQRTFSPFNWWLKSVNLLLRDQIGFVHIAVHA